MSKVKNVKKSQIVKGFLMMTDQELQGIKMLKNEKKHELKRDNLSHTSFEFEDKNRNCSSVSLFYFLFFGGMKKRVKYTKNHELLPFGSGCPDKIAGKIATSRDFSFELSQFSDEWNFL